MSGKTKQMNDWFIVNKKETGAEIIIYDSIGYDGYDMGETFAGFKKAADELDDYTIRIHSPGGFVDTGLAIYDYNKERAANGANIHVRIDGVCASIATVIALSGSKLPELTPNASVMIHPVKGGVYGEIKEMETALEHATRNQNKVANIYKKELGWSDEYVNQLMSPMEETWYHGEEAVDKGFCARVIEAPEVESNRLVACWDMKAAEKKYNFKNESNLYKQSGGKMPKDKNENNGGDGAQGQQNNTAPPVTLEGMMAMMQTMQQDMAALGENNKTLAGELETAKGENSKIQAQLDAANTEKATLETEKAQAEAKSRKVKACADYKEGMSKLGTEEDIVAIRMAVQDNCSEEIAKKLDDVLMTANNVIAESGFDSEKGKGGTDSGADLEVQKTAYMEELKKEDPSITEYEMEKAVNRKFMNEEGVK